MTSEGASLSAEQNMVLQRIYEYFHAHGSWPTFITIDRPLRREHGINTAAVVQSLPESMIVPPRQGMPPISTDELRLRLQGVACCSGSSRDTSAFVEVLRWFAEKEAAYEPQPGSEADMPRVTSAEISEYFVGQADEVALKRLYEMLHLDNWGIGGSGSGEDGGWYINLTPNVWRFRNVETVEDCIKAQEDWSAEQPPPPYANADATLRLIGQVTPAATLYVDAQVVSAIRAKEGQSTFEVAKLLRLVDELNDNYARRNTYASHMLLRAILDHVPPLFKSKDFAGVVNNYSWGRTDKRYIKRLADFRDQADDALHRQISAKPCVLDFDDMPASVNVDRLLQECAALL